MAEYFINRGVEQDVRKQISEYLDSLNIRIINLEIGGGIGTVSNLDSVPAVDEVEITNTGGTNALIDGATESQAGVMTAAQVQQLNAGGSGTTSNLGTTYASNYATITNTGGDDTNINAATTSLAGLMTSADKTALGTFLTTVDLSYTRTSTTVTVTNTAGANAVLPAATSTTAGVMSAQQVQDLESAVGGGLTRVDLDSQTTTSQVQITNTGGDDAIIDGATLTHAGVMTSAQVQQLNDAVGGGTVTDLGNSAGSTTVEITNTGGDNTTLPAATLSNAGVMTAAQVQQLNDAGGGTVTDLGNTQTSTSVTITNTGGDNTIIPQATPSNAGVMTAAQVDTLNDVITEVDLSLSRNSTSNIIGNTAGDNVTLLASTSSLAGLMTAAQVDELDSAIKLTDTFTVNRAPATNEFTLRSNNINSWALPVVTASLSGLMSFQDKQKLDGLDAATLPVLRTLFTTLLPKMELAGIITPAEELALMNLTDDI